MKLGKKPATMPRVRPMREMLGLARKPLGLIAPVPPRTERAAQVKSWPMLDNDRVGDCTIAAVGHAVQLMTTIASDARVMTDAEALTGYEKFGYVPGDEATDRGCDAQDVLASWTGAGFAVGGENDRLTGFCAINPRVSMEVRAGIAWLGVVYAGLALPLAVQGADSWDVQPANDHSINGAWVAGSWGGHAVPIVDYDPEGLTVITWGETLRMSWPFLEKYCDEAYGILSKDFASSQIAPQNWTALEAEMAALRAEAA